MTTTAPSVLPYGSWRSPISIDDVLAGAVRLWTVELDGPFVYWLEARPEEGGRASVWRRRLEGGPSEELTPSAYVRTRVYEYGGGEFDVRGGQLVYSDFGDGRLYLQRDGGEPRPLTPAGAWRYGDLRVHPDRGLVLAVREDHSGEGEAVVTVVAVPLDGDGTEPGRVLCSGADFYATPELSSSGRLAWVEWDHPNMPWDTTTILVGDLGGSHVENVVTVAGGSAESCVQPRWLDDETLLFVSDRTDWWNLYAWQGGDVRALWTTDAEFCSPQWLLGQNPYAVLDHDRLLCSVNRSGEQTVGVLQLHTGEFTPIAETGTYARRFAVRDGVTAALLGHDDRPSDVCLYDAGAKAWEQVRTVSDETLDQAYRSVAEAVHWAGPAGVAHGWFYAPRNADHLGPQGTLPPLKVFSHGGPTGFATSEFRLVYQFWTTRGYAILDVNYGGSTGYGRAYRQRLQGTWGVVDVGDCATGAEAMGDQGRVDPERLAVEGGSAGGYTTLRALTATRTFHLGISEYGIGDLEAMARETHKFESRYLDGLVAPYPEGREVYVERSPIHHVDDLAAPILLFQGTEDKVVPPNQAETMAAAARKKGLPVALLMFEGEGHGFRRADTIRAVLQAELYFLGRIFGCPPADDVPAIPIDNLD